MYTNLYKQVSTFRRLGSENMITYKGFFCPECGLKQIFKDLDPKDILECVKCGTIFTINRIQKGKG